MTAGVPEGDGRDSKGARALEEIRMLRERLAPDVSSPLELPEPDVTLGIEERRGQPLRIYKHILQCSVLHREHFARASMVKHMYLLDGFLSALEDENPMTLHATARGMFELSAFLHEVCARLNETVLRVTTTNWQPLGEKFFAVIARARYATSDPAFRKLLIDAGTPESRLKPFNITECVKGLSAEDGFEDSGERYASLCDFVHHNLGSATTANLGVRQGTVARSGLGGVVTPDVQTITAYAYPVRGKINVYTDRIAPGVLRDANASIRWINELPQGPFPFEMNVQMTGTQLGIDRIR